MNNCIFCKIINKQIPSYCVYEDEFTYAFLDIADDYEGHTLVIPKKHYKNILDCDIETLNHITNTIQKISKHYINNCGYQGVNILNANEIAAEQSVFHLHFHVIPRTSKDNFSLWAKRVKQNCNFDELVAKLQIK